MKTVPPPGASSKPTFRIPLATPESDRRVLSKMLIFRAVQSHKLQLDTRTATGGCGRLQAHPDANPRRGCRRCFPR